MRRVTSRTTKPQFYWVVEGFDSEKEIYSERIKATLISPSRMESLLKTLTARAGLTFDEIVGAYVIKGAKRHNAHLEVHRDVKHSTLMCGSDPCFAARLIKT